MYTKAQFDNILSLLFAVITKEHVFKSLTHSTCLYDRLRWPLLLSYTLFPGKWISKKTEELETCPVHKLSLHLHTNICGASVGLDLTGNISGYMILL